MSVEIIEKIVEIIEKYYDLRMHISYVIWVEINSKYSYLSLVKCLVNVFTTHAYEYLVNSLGIDSYQM